MAKQQQAESKPPVEEPRVATSTYYAARGLKDWEVWRVDVYDNGKLARECVVTHPQRAVVRQRLQVFLDGVLP